MIEFDITLVLMDLQIAGSFNLEVSMDIKKKQGLLGLIRPELRQREVFPKTVSANRMEGEAARMTTPHLSKGMSKDVSMTCFQWIFLCLPSPPTSGNGADLQLTAG